ncbi:MAG TPA: methionine adenosyltransferase [Longimicrobiales bacterium]|nr:methionine adenosyltransferase [Longimicrobiales bacterium]
MNESSTASIFTSESVSEGHPDKVADRISDAVLDAYLARDPEAKVACETLVTHGYLCIAGEVTCRGGEISKEQIAEIARECITDIGYAGGWDLRFDVSNVEIDVRLHAQSAEINAAVEKKDRKSQGAGDQGMMFGYASNETEQLMPAPIVWAHGLTRELARLRRSGEVAWLRPDSKSQVSIRYEDGRPVEVTRIVVSTQHDPGVTQRQIHDLLADRVIPRIVPSSFIPGDLAEVVLANPSGSFVEGGPATDTGLTGRKIIVDTYGGMARHGGGAFSGKDPSKVDRSAAYAARHVAKNVVANGLAERCEIQLAYAIGVAQPLAMAVETYGTGTRGDEAIAEWIREHFDLSPRGISEDLELLRPIYSPTAAYGHFGREPGVDGAFPWERIRSFANSASAAPGRAIAAR